MLYADNWDESLFLRDTLKPIRKIYYEEALVLREKLGGDESTKKLITLLELPENKVKLYVSLYQSNGHDYKQWEAQLTSLESYMIGQPVYKK